MNSQTLDPQFALTPPEPRSLARRTPADLLELALEKEANIDVIERFAKLLSDERDYQARVDFDSALNGCQAQIGRIAPNQKRENGIMWADYAQLDRAIRPIYVNAGFSIGFSEVDTPDKSRLRMCATLSNRGISREYFADISRAPANSSMKQVDADASAASRVKRYLMLDIFNIAIGIDKDEKEPYQAKPEDLMDESIVMDFVALIEGSGDVDELKKNYLTATQAGANDPSALRAFDKAKKTTWKGKGFRA